MVAVMNNDSGTCCILCILKNSNNNNKKNRQKIVREKKTVKVPLNSHDVNYNNITRVFNFIFNR